MEVFKSVKMSNATFLEENVYVIPPCPELWHDFHQNQSKGAKWKNINPIFLISNVLKEFI